MTEPLNKYGVDDAPAPVAAKYGVDTAPRTAAPSTRCPLCGAPLARLDPPCCNECGTAPFEGDS